MRNGDEFLNAPWKTAEIQGFDAARAVPTMLAAEEQALYAWLTAHWMQDIGAVVDLGCFVGGSTARLAAGLAAGARKAHLHAFDKFTCDEDLKRSMLYPAGIAPFEGRETLSLVRDLLTPWQDRITLHPGQIEQQHWDKGPIELLVMDASKRIDTMDQMGRTFFPSLIPGQSLVIQQDYLQWRQPWVPVQMEAMSDWFTPIAHVPNDTVVFLNTVQIDDAALEAGRVEAMSENRKLSLLRAAKKRGDKVGYGKHLRPSIQALKANPGVVAAFDLQAPTKEE